MADAKKPSSKEVQASRKYLEGLLLDCRKAKWTGGEDMIKMIEKALAKLRQPVDGSMTPAPPPRNASPSADESMARRPSEVNLPPDGSSQE